MDPPLSGPVCHRPTRLDLSSRGPGESATESRAGAACGQVGGARQVNKPHLSRKERRERERASTSTSTAPTPRTHTHRRSHHTAPPPQSSESTRARAAQISPPRTSSRDSTAGLLSRFAGVSDSVPAAASVSGIRSYFWGFFFCFVFTLLITCGFVMGADLTGDWRRLWRARREARVRVPPRCSGRDGCSARGPSAGSTPPAAATTTTAMRPSGPASPPSRGERA